MQVLYGTVEGMSNILEAHMVTAQDGRRAVNVDEAGRLINIGRTLAWKLVNSGELRSIRVGHRVVVPMSAIDEFLEGRSPATQDTTPQA